MNCKTHPRYKAMKYPKGGKCHTCWILWRLQNLINEGRIVLGSYFEGIGSGGA